MQDRAGWSPRAGPSEAGPLCPVPPRGRASAFTGTAEPAPTGLRIRGCFLCKISGQEKFETTNSIDQLCDIHSFIQCYSLDSGYGVYEGAAMLRPACGPRVTSPVTRAERAMRGRRPQSPVDSRGHCVCDAGGVRGSRGCRLGRKLRALGRVWTTGVWDGQEGHCAIQAKAGGQAVCEGQRAWRDGAESEGGVQEDPCLGPEPQECVLGGAELRWKDRCPVWVLGERGRAGSGGSRV